MATTAVPASAGPVPTGARVSSFPLGWYDAIRRPERLSQFGQEGIDLAVPYNRDGVDPTSYLDSALVSGVGVMLMIDRALAAKPDLARVRSYVARFKSHPALSGWHLADEPTIYRERISPENARKVYRTIRSVDPDHPVAIVFGVSEDARPFIGAMDIMMLDDFVCVAKRPEFSTLPLWWKHLTDRAAIGRRVGGFIPVIQGFGGPFLGKRLPTPAETRYMAFASIVAGATGIVYWTRYRARSEWVRSVLSPVLTELRQLRPAFERQAIPGVRVAAPSVTASLFREPGDGSLILIAVHHGSGNVVAGLSVRSAALGGRAFEMRNGQARPADLEKDVFGPYEVRVYRLA
ncbi:MAG: hypothetical protein ACRDKJ_00835 [Actinomycetota bacterium]